MIDRMRAWIEILKIVRFGRISSISKEVDKFFRGNIIRVLDKEGWFVFLQEPQSIDEIATYFQYSDKIFLKNVLDTLVHDKTLKVLENTLYQINAPVDTSWAIPRVFSESLKDICINYAEWLPNRLNARFDKFTGGINLFNWDDALSSHLYAQMRASAFAFSGALSKSGKFLDIGCGNGFQTAAIWLAYLNQNKIQSMKIIGMDVNENLLEIARNEFPQMISVQSGKDVRTYKKFAEFFPEYTRGSIDEIPAENDSFDVVYVSQVLHWIDPQQALKEMLRIVKPKGLIFGTENFPSNKLSYNNLHYKVVENAYGVLDKQDFISWVKQAGAKKVSVATPLSVFKIIK